jgi:DNA repair photolyase
MKISEIKVPSLTKEITHKDDLFHGAYTIDPYQNCSFGCVYCDSTYDKNIAIKINAVEKLKEELPTMKYGRIIIGSVHDPYQDIEKSYHLTRSILHIIKEYNFPIHILTKSTAILNDLNLLSKFSDVIITFSLVTMDKEISRYIEKFTPTPYDRLEAMQTIHEMGIKTGVALIPIIPYINDNEFEIIIKNAKKYNASYLLSKYLELKGDQKTIFYNFLNKYFPDKKRLYDELFADYFIPNTKYQKMINQKISLLCKQYKIQTKLF